jgi:environmental stress-induced protein Ves
MPVRRFSRSNLSATPWKNGGGTTHEIACWPADAALGEFGWRVSIAAIAAGGPFSVFEGIDRQIMLLEGDGVHLQSADGSIDHRLDVPHRPFAFSGDARVDCTLLGGVSSDFNLMTRRGLWRGEVQVLDGAASIAAAPHGVLLALCGDWRLDGDEPACREGEGLRWNDTFRAGHAAPLSNDARLAVVRIVPASAANA